VDQVVRHAVEAPNHVPLGIGINSDHARENSTFVPECSARAQSAASITGYGVLTKPTADCADRLPHLS
jgi:hypothetical protein